jgi:hypothetical protein
LEVGSGTDGKEPKNTGKWWKTEEKMGTLPEGGKNRAEGGENGNASAVNVVEVAG